MSRAVPFAEALVVWLRIALLSFGGPAGQIAVMHRILVEEKGWIDERRFLQALNYCMLLPGPEAMQLATYMGWMLHGVRGGLVAGALFVLPGFLSILALSYVYLAYADTTWLAAAFWGIKAAVLAIIVHALYKLGRKVLRTPSQLILAAAALVAMFIFAAPFPAVIIAAAVIGMVCFQGKTNKHATPQKVTAALRRQTHAAAGICLLLWLLPLAGLFLAQGGQHVLTQIGLFFSKLAMVTFGGAYAVLAYMAQAAVEDQHWLTAAQMLDGLGLAESTPGPLIMVTQFVGFLAAAPAGLAFWGAVLATWVTFMPCFVWIFAGAPHLEKLTNAPRLAAALQGITTAVMGVIANLALWFAVRTLFTETQKTDFWGVGLTLPIWSSIDTPFVALFVAAFAMLTIARMGLFSVLGACFLVGILFIS